MLHEKELTSKGKVRALYKVSWYSWTMCFTIPKASALAPKKNMPNKWCESGNQFGNEKLTQDLQNSFSKWWVLEGPNPTISIAVALYGVPLLLSR